jgi:hypothetical protein
VCVRRAAARDAAVLLAVAGLLAPPRALAFDSRGHDVIEALAYRSLVEGRDGQPPRPEVLRFLVNDGALDAPYCFGWGDDPPEECRKAPARNPLLCWPHPETSRPDAFFRRQFSDPGQCFHYMGMMDDALSDPLPGTEVPRALATSAVVRCNDLLDLLVRQIVVVGGPGIRTSGFGLYELLHSVQDSFSEAHTARALDGVDYLRVWKPIEKLVSLPTERANRIPDTVFHLWDDHRDKTYVTEGGADRCESRTGQPYDVPYECLSPEGDRARGAVVDLLVLVRDLRQAQLDAPAGTDTHPEASPAWRAYKARWFTPVHACEGAECAARNPPDVETGRYAYLGADVRFTSPGALEAGARASILRYAEDLNPFVYSLNVTAGYQYDLDAGSNGYVGLGFGLSLPFGFHAALGLTAAELRAIYGAASSVEILTRLLRFDYQIGRGLLLSVEAPLAVNWVQPRVHWTAAVGLSWGVSSVRFVGGDSLLHHEEHADRHDDDWVPPPAPYGRLSGRRLSVLPFIEVAPTTVPSDTVAGRTYGAGVLGVELAWDRDRWGERYSFTPTISFAAGIRNTTGESTYLTGTLGVGLRWYFLGPIALSVTAASLEAGPKIRGKDQLDGTTGVQGPPGSEYFLVAGSRLGLAVRLGVADLLVQGPTVTWTSQPFGLHEVLGFRIAIQL